MRSPQKVCFTGGEEGSDYVWGRFSLKYGWTPYSLSFNNHNVYEKTVGEVLRLPPKYLRVADAYLEKANRILQRQFPTKNEYVDNLIRRNYYQIVDSQQVCGIGTLSKDYLTVNGVTGWSIQMAIDMNLPVHVFDQKLEHWVTWDDYLGIFNICETPMLKEKFTGIGTPNISRVGIIAIKEVFRKTTS